MGSSSSPPPVGGGTTAAELASTDTEYTDWSNVVLEKRSRLRAAKKTGIEFWRFKCYKD